VDFLSLLITNLISAGVLLALIRLALETQHWVKNLLLGFFALAVVGTCMPHLGR
jgi:hypothetical protein